MLCYRECERSLGKMANLPSDRTDRRRNTDRRVAADGYSKMDVTERTAEENADDEKAENRSCLKNQRQQKIHPARTCG